MWTVSGILAASVLERYHPAVVACLDFIRPIADAYAEGRLLEGDLTSERNSRLARIKKMQKADGEKDKPKRLRISTKQPAGAKKSGCQPVDANQPQPNTSGGDSQETNADGTSQPKPTGKANAKSAAQKPKTTLAMKATNKEPKQKKEPNTIILLITNRA